MLIEDTVLASSTEAQQWGGRSIAETGNENSAKDIAHNVPVASPENLLTWIAKNSIEVEHQSEVLVGTGERDLLFSGEKSIGSQYEIASPSRFDNDFEMTTTAPTPARNHKRLQLSRLAK